MDNEDSISLFFEKFKKCYIKRKKKYTIIRKFMLDVK